MPLHYKAKLSLTFSDVTAVYFDTPKRPLTYISSAGKITKF